MIFKEKDIDRGEWRRLVETSATGTWFQGPEAYDFFASMPELFKPFAVAVAQDAEHLDAERLDPADLELRTRLRGICVGYITVEKSAIKQTLTHRAIIVGGPVIADDATDAEVCELMKAVRKELKGEAIYVECRNFNDYSKWKDAFKKAGFEYVPHLNFHVDTSSVDVVESNLGKSRKRDIKTSIRDGATIVELDAWHQLDAKHLETASLESSTLDAKHLETAFLVPADLEKKKAEELRMLHEYYDILQNLYMTRVKTPLFPFSFFEKLWQHKDGRYILVALNNEIIGGTVCVEQEGKCLYEWFACGRDGEWKTIFPSTVATYSGIRYAVEHNCPRFDMMGAGKPDEAYGVRDFKAKFGGKEVEHGRFLCITQPILYQIGKLGVWLLKRLK